MKVRSLFRFIVFTMLIFAAKALINTIDTKSNKIVLDDINSSLELTKDLANENNIDLATIPASYISYEENVEGIKKVGNNEIRAALSTIEKTMDTRLNNFDQEEKIEIAALSENWAEMINDVNLEEIPDNSRTIASIPVEHKKSEKVEFETLKNELFEIAMIEGPQGDIELEIKIDNIDAKEIIETAKIDLKSNTITKTNTNNTQIDIDQDSTMASVDSEYSFQAQGSFEIIPLT